MEDQVILVKAVNAVLAVAAPNPCIGNTVANAESMPLRAIQFMVTNCVTRFGALAPGLDVALTVPSAFKEPIWLMAAAGLPFGL